VGGLISRIKKRNSNIARHWQHLTRKLDELGLVRNREFRKRGHNYFLRDNIQRTWTDGACVIGDAAGLATRDLGEGIGPAVQSAILAAHAIAERKTASYSPIPRYSLPRMIMAGWGLYV
jgi:flavin-dependent dehydrogenase